MSTQNNDGHDSTEEPPTPATPPAATPDEEQGDEEQGNVSRETTEEQDDEEQELRQTFDRDYVERLRGKSANYRLRMKDAESQVETLRRELFTERLTRLDMIVDLDAVPYDPSLLEDSDSLQRHVEELLESKPYLRKRHAGGNIGQHTAPGGNGGFSLLEAMRGNAS